MGSSMTTSTRTTTTTTLSNTRERLLAAAAELIVELGWRHVTMTLVAKRAGFSRRMVYYEVGTKEDVGLAVVLRELGRFLGRVERGFDTHPDDLEDALTAAIGAVLDMAEDNALLAAIIRASFGGQSDLLPYLSTDGTLIAATAEEVVVRRVSAYPVHLPEAELTAAAEQLVRLVLSHVLRPSRTPAESTASIVAFALPAFGAAHTERARVHASNGRAPLRAPLAAH